MSRKDYRLLAAALARVVDDRTNDAETARAACAAIASTLATDNARFDRDRFMTACGVVQS